MRKIVVGLLALAFLLIPLHGEAAQATLEWADTANNEDGFHIERKPGLCTAAGTFVVLGQVGVNIATYVDLTVVEGAPYSYRVDAFNTAGKSPYSNCAEITIAYTVPLPPSGAAYGVNVLTWVDNSPNETGFRVERKQEACTGTLAFAAISTVPTNQTNYNDTNVIQGQKYCYRVAAVNPAGSSPFSNTAERLVPFTIPVAPGQLQVK